MDGISMAVVAPGASAVAVVGAEGLLPSSLGRSTPEKPLHLMKER